jgi:hypothetical protein
LKYINPVLDPNGLIIDVCTPLFATVSRLFFPVASTIPPFVKLSRREVPVTGVRGEVGGVKSPV